MLARSHERRDVPGGQRPGRQEGWTDSYMLSSYFRVTAFRWVSDTDRKECVGFRCAK